MKKLYTIISVLTSVFSIHAQVSLTKALNQPVLGDVDNKQVYDSVGIVPKNSGANQLWDFSNFAFTSNLEVSNYISVASAGGASYTGSSFAESYGSTNFFMKATATQYEIVGIQNSNFSLNFSSNTAIKFVWPIAMGYVRNDPFSGTANANNMNGNVSGSISSTAPGTGTLILPGGNTFTGVLQVKIRLAATASFLFGFTTVNLKAVDYTYYDASQKFPLLTVSYQTITGAYTSNSASIRVNSTVVGINDLNFDATFNVFPNPAKDNVNVKLSNQHKALCTIEIIDAIGQTAKMINLGNQTDISENISITDLASGMYLIKTTLGDKVSSRKLIVE
jgi:hypothetical protein